MSKQTQLGLQLAASAASIGLALAAGSAQAAAAKCKQNLSAADRVVALNEIQNLMGKYSHLGVLRGEGTLEELFAMKTEGVFWKTPTGPVGIQGMKDRFARPAEDPMKNPGQIHEHSMFSPVIEIAADGKTAQGVWDSFGPNIQNGNEVGNWLWVKYGVDFVKEEGEWKIWHLQVFALFNTPYDKSITESAKERAAGGGQRPAGAPPGGAPGGAGGPPAQGPGGPATGGPNQNWSGPEGGPQWIYDGKTPARGPYVPEPYCTYDPAKSSAKYYDYYSAPAAGK